jgi:hypothetical protein
MLHVHNTAALFEAMTPLLYGRLLLGWNTRGSTLFSRLVNCENETGVTSSVALNRQEL